MIQFSVTESYNLYEEVSVEIKKMLFSVCLMNISYLAYTISQKAFKPQTYSF